MRASAFDTDEFLGAWWDAGALFKTGAPRREGAGDDVEKAGIVAQSRDGIPDDQGPRVLWRTLYSVDASELRSYLILWFEC